MSRLSRIQDAPSQVWVNNPTITGFLGISPLLAISQSSIVGSALAFSTAVVCFASAATVYGLRSVIRPQHVFLWVTAIMSCYTTILAQLMEVWFYPLVRELGIYLYLIACNFALLVKLPSYRNSACFTVAVEDAARLSVAFGASLIGFSMLRELLISRTLFANIQLLLPRSFEAIVTPESTGISTFVASAPGAFILLGLLIAICQALGMRSSEAYYHQDEQPVERARITGRLKSDRD